MATSATVPMLSPDGQSGDIPKDQVQAAVAKGFKPAVSMTSPDGKIGYVPLDKQQDALNAHFKLTGPPAQSEDNKWYGFTPSNLLSNVGAGLKQLAQGAVQGFSDIGGAIDPQFMGGDPINNLALVRHIVQPMQDEAAKARADQARLGYTSLGGALHAVASGLPILGPLVSNLAEQAATGDVGGAVARGATMAYAPKLIGPAAELATKGVAKAALLGKTPEGAMESALKPSTTLSSAERAGVTDAALKNKIPVSAAGLEKLHGLIEDANQKISDEIAKDPNRPIDTQAVATRADVAKAKFAKQVNAQGDLDAIEASKQQFLKENPTLTAADAQAMKQGTYRVLKGKYGEQGSAAVESQKALARGLKEEIATAFPEISNLNAHLSELLDLQPVLERAVNRISNHQLIGIGTPIAGAAASAVTGSAGIGKVAMVMKAVLDNPNVKSRLAIAVSNGAKIPYSQALTRVNNYSSKFATAAAATQDNDESPSQ